MRRWARHDAAMTEQEPVSAAAPASVSLPPVLAGLSRLGADVGSTSALVGQVAETARAEGLAGDDAVSALGIPSTPPVGWLGFAPEHVARDALGILLLDEALPFHDPDTGGEVAARIVVVSLPTSAGSMAVARELVDTALSVPRWEHVLDLAETPEDLAERFAGLVGTTSA